jgi:DNA transformation protein and related proteins
MSASPDFTAFVQDLFAPLGGLSIRRMFGGAGVYSRGVMFALIDDDTLYLKADGETQKAFQDRNCDPFVYENGAGKPVVMSYWQMPPELIEDQEEALVWAKTALEVARAAKADLPPSSRRVSTAARWRR